ncbi:hypothetical protein A9Q02_00935 [Candidatus Chloroploca asiatica]|uniref:Glycosyl transferase family 1 domain-containing protein n=2 Tax=Candidatus Chloroploca asiatica TaxID=1506545 RepID=A0A2H3KNM0_9CHLR|nr:hypothetical protein A9Q02_00935 [Candidatus Chloroploca asiatica]
MDLRDLWSQSHLIVGTSSYNKTYLQEQEYLRSADKTLVVTEGIRRLTLKKFPELREDKVFTLTNGYDVDDFRDIKVKFINKKFTLTFIGSWYKARSENSFISALYQLATNSNFLQRIQFRFVGNISADIQKQLAPLADTGFIVFRPQVTHREALSEVLNADVVILIESNLFELKLNHSNKLFEYLGSGKPILAIAPIDGEAAQLIRQERAGIVVDPDNPNEICYGIVDLFNRFEHNPHRDIVLGTYPNYNRKNLTRELANILDEVCAQKILDRE